LPTKFGTSWAHPVAKGQNKNKNKNKNSRLTLSLRDHGF